MNTRLENLAGAALAAPAFHNQIHAARLVAPTARAVGWLLEGLPGVRVVPGPGWVLVGLDRSPKLAPAPTTERVWICAIRDVNPSRAAK